MRSSFKGLLGMRQMSGTRNYRSTNSLPFQRLMLPDTRPSRLSECWGILAILHNTGEDEEQEMRDRTYVFREIQL